MLDKARSILPRTIDLNLKHYPLISTPTHSFRSRLTFLSFHDKIARSKRELKNFMASLTTEDSLIVSKTQPRAIFSFPLKTSLYLVVKRFFDILFGLLGCLALVPLTVLVRLAFFLTGDFGPLFFKQKRLGKNGKLFTMYKFRSMVKNADKILEEKLKSDADFAKKYTKKMKLDHDPRITKFGAFLRKSSLDEVPQFINVLKGDMSLIGNRPYLPREKSHINRSLLEDILKTKPGITGIWQTSGRSNVSFKNRLKLEADYSSDTSITTDLSIFLKTFKAVFYSKGAK